MSARLAGKRIALLVEDLFEASEVTGPREALQAEGAEVVLVGPLAQRQYRDKAGEMTITSELAAGAARIKDFDAVVIPGGYAPDKMRMRHAMTDLVKDAVAVGKPVAAISYGPQVLISANVVRGRMITCWPSIAIDIKNAGGMYVDRPAVNDGNVITARKSYDMAAFNDAIIAAIVG